MPAGVASSPVTGLGSGKFAIPWARHTARHGEKLSHLLRADVLAGCRRAVVLCAGSLCGLERWRGGLALGDLGDLTLGGLDTTCSINERPTVKGSVWDYRSSPRSQPPTAATSKQTPSKAAD